MRKNIYVSRGAALWLGAAVLTASGQAAAAACPTGSNVVYVSGSSAFKSILQATQVAPSGANTPCTPPGTTPETTVDIGISDVYPSTCLNYAPTLSAVGSGTMTKDYLGPIQAMVLAVPTASIANSISAEAAYMVFKFAADTTAHSIPPWIIPGDIFTRYYDSGVLNMTGAALGNGTKTLTAGNWANAQCATPGTSACPNTATSNGNMASHITGAATSTADINAAIGDIAAQTAATTTGIKALAFQGVGQTCGYYPDSSNGNGDKVNVREGRYDIWGPEHLVVKVDGSGNPVGQNGNTAAVQAVIAALIATSTAPLAASVDSGVGLTETQVGSIVDIISAAASGAIPQCAMQVQRSGEDGAESSYSPPAPCTCRFLSAATGTTPSMCTPCGASADGGTCPSPQVCRFGYCEAY